jgi:hypothetical protein
LFEANRLVERAQTLLEQIEWNRAKLAQSERKQRKQIETLERLLQDHPISPAGIEGLDAPKIRPESTVIPLDSVRREGAPSYRELETQLERAKNEARAAVKTRDDAVEKLAQVTRAHAALEIEAENLRNELDGRDTELDALRREAAAQVAAAQTQAGEIERRASQFLATQDVARQTVHFAASAIHAIREQVLETVDNLAKILERLNEASVATVEHAPAPDPRKRDSAGARRPSTVDPRPLRDPANSSLRLSQPPAPSRPGLGAHERYDDEPDSSI